ncbi:unnamed protein product [Effrenium voratum]|nr:unnamed protein product [Effrenium voratum]
MIISIGLQLSIIALLLLYNLFRACSHWRGLLKIPERRPKANPRTTHRVKGLQHSRQSASTLVPTLEQLVALPPPGPVLMWAVRWDLDIRALVDDLKNEGPEAVEKYLQNEAFMLKLRKIVRNVVSQSEMIRITQEVRMRRELQRFQTDFQKSSAEEDEDARAWAAMMREMTGAPEQQQAELQDVDAAAPSAAPAAAFEGDDAAALEAMMAVMNRKPFDEAPAPAAPFVAPAAAALDDDDAAALEAMMAVMNRKPFDPPEAPAPAPAAPAPAAFEGDDAAAWEAMMAVMNRKPNEAAPAPAATAFEGDDAAALAAMMASEPEAASSPAYAPEAAALDDDAALEAMMAVMNRKPFEAGVSTELTEKKPELLADSDCSTDAQLALEKSESEQSDDFAEFWVQLEEMERGGLSLEEQAQKLVSLCMQLPDGQHPEEPPQFFNGEVSLGLLGDAGPGLPLRSSSAVPRPKARGLLSAAGARVLHWRGGGGGGAKRHAAVLHWRRGEPEMSLP